jgi:hypothetical protein
LVNLPALRTWLEALTTRPAIFQRARPIFIITSLKLKIIA